MAIAAERSAGTEPGLQANWHFSYLCLVQRTVQPSLDANILATLAAKLQAEQNPQFFKGRDAETYPFAVLH